MENSNRRKFADAIFETIFAVGTGSLGGTVLSLQKEPPSGGSFLFRLLQPASDIAF